MNIARDPDFFCSCWPASALVESLRRRHKFCKFRKLKPSS